MKKKMQDLANIDALEIETLTDEELEMVDGGATDITTVASCSCCISGATNIGGGKPAI
jgi:lactobin A/cerein 7B family class IIb bacteriocin